MARTATKTRTSDAVPLLTTLPERVSVLEVKVQNIDEKIDDVKSDISLMHSSLVTTLSDMRTESTTQHNELANKVKDLEGFKNKWVKYGMVLLAFAAGAGWISNPHIAQLFKFFGL